MDSKKLLVLSVLLSSIIYGTQNMELGESVIYSTTGFAENIRDEASSPVVITKKEIEEKRYKTAIEILKDVPAVNVQYQMGMPIIDLSGQGMKAKDNVQVLIDGVPVNSLETSMVASVINTISVDSIERIEVIPGGGAVLYGSGTAGGVVNIITKKEVAQELLPDTVMEIIWEISMISLQAIPSRKDWIWICLTPKMMSKDIATTIGITGTIFREN